MVWRGIPSGSGKRHTNANRMTIVAYLDNSHPHHLWACPYPCPECKREETLMELAYDDEDTNIVFMECQWCGEEYSRKLGFPELYPVE